MNNNFLFKLKMATILKVVLCSLFIFFSSCSKFEEENNQTPVVPNINEAQAVIGGENWFEDYVNIEDFKNMKVEDDITYLKHQEALQKMAKHDKFPNFKEAWEMGNLISKMRFEYDFFSWKFFEPSNFGRYIFGNFSHEHSGYTNYDFAKRSEPFVPCYVEKIDNEFGTYNVLLTPKEARDKISANIRHQQWHSEYDKFERYFIPLDLYCSATGIPKEDFKDLRVVSQKFRWYNLWYYQMPHNDNYKDYQNDTREVRDFDELKYYIKKGSLIFVFDKPREKLDEISGKYFGHMMIMTDWYTDKIDKYIPLVEYHLVSKNEDFCNIPFLYKELMNRDGNFLDYLKHFVFIEAQKDPMHNKNKLQGFERDKGVMLTSGNDERFQEYIKKATCIAVVNLNDGYNYSHPNLVDNMINNALNQLGKEYNPKPSRYDFFEKHYCSGLVWFSFFNEDEYPSLKILLPKHRTLPLHLGYWYMPRTVCNSPFVYTRVWYKK